MKIDNEFAVNAPVERAWTALTDLEGLAPCLPGAQLTGVEPGPEGDIYNGKVKVKVGPVISQFAGTASFVERDADARHAVVGAKGKDARGGGNASAVIDMRLRPDGDDRTVVSVHTDLSITGKLAQFGSGMIKEISEKLLAQFVSNLEESLRTPEAAPSEAAPPEGAPSEAETPPATAPATTPEPGSAAGSAARTAPATAPEPVREAEPVPASTRTSAPTSTPASSASSQAPAASASASTPEAPATSETAPASETPAASAAPPASAARAASAAPEKEAEALDLMGLAGASVYKRLIPVGVAVLVIVAVIVLVVVL